jgi:hypothetical protein
LQLYFGSADFSADFSDAFSAGFGDTSSDGGAMTPTGSVFHRS